MRSPWQGPHVLEASAPSAGACHRCALIAQVPATRSAAERWHRRDEGAPWHAPGLRTLARSRGPACRDGGKRRRHAEALRAIQLSCVTTATVCLRHRRTAPATACRAQFRPGSSRPLVFQGKVRYAGIHSPTFPRHFLGRSLGPSGRPRPAPAVAVIRPRRPLPAAVRRRSLPDRYRSVPRRPALSARLRAGPVAGL